MTSRQNWRPQVGSLEARSIDKGGLEGDQEVGLKGGARKATSRMRNSRGMAGGSMRCTATQVDDQEAIQI